MGIAQNNTPETIFWQWFSEHQQVFQRPDYRQHQLANILHERLRAYCAGLAFEIAIGRDGLNELVISADGIMDYFPAVQKLVAAAPDLDAWRIVAFRPRMDGYNLAFGYGGRQFDPADIWFLHRVQDGQLNVILYHPGLRAEDRRLVDSASRILLDRVLGEYDAATGIGYVGHQPLPKEPEAEGLRRFAEFREVFDAFKRPHRGNNAAASANLWWPYLAPYQHGLGSTLLNLKLKQLAPLPDFPVLVVTGVAYASQQADGLPSAEEFSVLATIADKLIATLNRRGRFIHAGTFTYNRQQLHYFYIQCHEGIAQILHVFYETEFPDRTPSIYIEADPDWKAYLEFLFPNQQIIELYREVLDEIGYSPA